jgi:hypothetical protein
MATFVGDFMVRRDFYCDINFFDGLEVWNNLLDGEGRSVEFLVKVEGKFGIQKGKYRCNVQRNPSSIRL